MTTPTPAPVLDVVHFVAPNVNPAVPGLYAATDWQNDPLNRFLHGVEVRGANYGGDDASGVWATAWCAPPPLDNEERKEGDRPGILDAFDPITVWAYDQCDLTAASRAEVEERVQQILRLQEQTMVEREFAVRLLVDAADLGTTPTRDTLKRAVSYLEGQVAQTNTAGYFHASAELVALEPDLFIKSGTNRVTPSGHNWIIGGGYVEGLEDTIVVTSQPFGWRDAPTTRTAPAVRDNIYAAVAERSVNIGYEAVIAAVTIAPVTP